MALTIGDWTDATVNGKLVSTCTVGQTAAEKDSYTKKTPDSLDTDNAWTLVLSAALAPDGTALPVDIICGYADDFAVAGDDPATITSGGEFKTIMDDCRTCNVIDFVWHMDPDLAVADVVTLAAIAGGLKVKVPKVPYFAFNLDGSGALVATTVTWKIIQ